jgi:hypothetical protein
MRVFSRAALLLALGAVAATPRARAQSVVVGPLPSSLSALPGASITVPVVADLTSSGGASLGSTALRLTWRTGTLTYVSTGAGALGAPTVNADSVSAGILKVAVASPGGATGMAVLFNATFTVSGAAADTTILGLSVSEITAAGTFADLKPITAATRASFCTSTGTWGDVDADSAFTGHDALIMLTNAVGLPIAPYSVVNGDVDGNGVVDTRDALIVLSDAVGIPVTQFRIGHLNAGLCSLRSAAAVQIQPRTASVAIGDSLPVSVVVTDSVGALVQGVGVVWQTKDSAIVRPGAAGSLVAVAPGSTYALVFAQPGVKDSVPVTVTSTRHVWYVDPVVASANLGVELGSQLYPFSSIDTAVARAAANDTVRVGVADYGPVRIAKPLVVLGDSTAAGFPRLSSATANPTAPALRVDTVLSGTVEIRGLRLLNSQTGLVASAVQTLVLGSISVEGSRDVGLRVYGADSALLSHVSVVGAVAEGIELDSLRTAVLDHVRGDAIGSVQGASLPPMALRILQIGTVTADSLTLGSAGLFVDSAGTVTLHRIRVVDSRGPSLKARANAVSVVAGDFSGAAVFGGGAPVSYDTLSYTVGLTVLGGTVQFDSSKIHNNGLFALGSTGGSTVSLRADTVTGNYSASAEDASSAIYGFGWLRMAQSVFLNNGPGYVDIEGAVTDSVTMDSTVFDGTSAYVYGVAASRMRGGAVRHGAAPTFMTDAVSVVKLDSVEVTGNSIANWGFSGAVEVNSADTAVVNGMNAHDNASGALGVYGSSVLRVAGGSMLNNGFGQYSSRFTIQASAVGDARIYGLTLRDSTDVGIVISPSGTSRTAIDSSFLEGSGTLVQEVYSCCVANADTLIVSRSSLTGFRGTSTYGVYAEYLAKLAVTGSYLDSLSYWALYAYAVDTNLMSHDTIRAWGGGGMYAGYGGMVRADTNAFVGCVPSGVAIYAEVPGAAGITGNTLIGCSGLALVAGSYANSGPPVEVRGNALTGDTTTGLPGIRLYNVLGYVQVVDNTILGGGTDGINIATLSVDSARVDSNTVQQTRASGIIASNGVTHLTLTGNLVSDNQGYGLVMGSPFTATYNTVVRNLAGGVVDDGGGGSSFRLGNIVGNVPFGVKTLASSMQADSNWWGRSQGPKCAAGCDTTTTATGDSISGNVIFSPVVATGAVAGAPAIPAPPPAPIARLAAARGVVVPRSPAVPAGVPRAGTALQPAHAAASPAVARSVRSSGGPTRHHAPGWKPRVPR